MRHQAGIESPEGGGGGGGVRLTICYLPESS